MKKLADLGTREAWALVLGALADIDGQVGDEAQTVLSRARDPRVVRDLCERAGLASGDEWVTLRAAEALGRVYTVFDVRALLRCVAPNAPVSVGRRCGRSSGKRAKGSVAGGCGGAECCETLVAKLWHRRAERRR